MPTMHSIDDMLGSMAAQASGEPPLQTSAEEEAILAQDLCGALPEDDFKQQLMDPFKDYYDTKSGKLLDRDKVSTGNRQLKQYQHIFLNQALRTLSCAIRTDKRRARISVLVRKRTSAKNNKTKPKIQSNKGR